MLPDSISYLEIAWVALSTTGLFSNWWLWRDAIRSRHYWELEGMNGIVNVSTRSNERSSGVRTLVQALFVAVGLTAMSLPPNPRADVDPAWVQSIPAAGFMFVAVALVVDSILSRRDRERLIDLDVQRARREKAQAANRQQGGAARS